MSGLFIPLCASNLKRVILHFIKSFKTPLHKYFLIAQEDKAYPTSNRTTLLTDNEYHSGISPSDEWKVKMIDHWKSLENLTPKKDVNLYLYVPSEEAQGFRNLIEQHQLQAVVYSSFVAA